MRSKSHGADQSLNTTPERLPTHSHGFRPGHSAHGAVMEAQRYIQEGYDWVVDVDLERFFDRVNHDVLMGRLARKIQDKRMLKILRGFLNAGVMVNGVVIDREEGTPQGGPLSPLLANVLLDEIDKLLEARGHHFVRYADDCNIYVRSERAGARVMATMRKELARLHLRINEAKSAVDRPGKRNSWASRFEVARLDDACLHALSRKRKIEYASSRAAIVAPASSRS